MNVALLLLCACSTVSANFLINPGSEHVYSYSGRILSGIPELDPTFSGLAIDCKVLLQAGEAQAGNTTVKVALKDVQVSNFNQKLDGPLPLNWRTMETPATSPVTHRYRDFLQSPVDVMMVNWEVKKVTVSSEEPEWSLNFKKAVISAIKIQLPQGDEEHNRISRDEESWMGFQGGSSHSVPESWSVMEQGVDGVCENSYQVTELPEDIISEVERGLFKKDQCVGKKMYQVVRTRDITNCISRSIFIASRQHENCLVGRCNGASGKTSNTRFLGCGETRESFQLHAVINESELQHNLLAFNTEQVVTGTRQVLGLQEVRLSHSQLPDIRNSRAVEDLLYQFPSTATAEQRKQITSHRKQQEYFRDQANNPEDQVFRPDGQPRLMDLRMKQRIVQRFSQVASDLRDMEHFGRKQVTSVLHSLNTVISVRNMEELKSLYYEVKGKATERKLLIDTVTNSGSSPSVMFCKEMIMSGEFSFLEATEVIVSLPHNIKAPTAKIMEELYELITSPAVTSHNTLKANGHIALATIINKACFHPNDLTTAAVFPVDVLGEMCDPSKDRTINRFISHLERELLFVSKQETQAAIIALGALGHQAAISILIPYIDGSGSQSTEIRKMAIYSLSQVSYQHRNTLLPVYVALINNPSEVRDIRIAAFSVLLSMDPSIVHLQKIAISTWFEKDEQMARFVYSSLKSLSQIKRTQIPNDSKLFSLTLKAATVFPLTKPFPGIISSNFNSFFSDMLKELHVGYQGHGSITTFANSQTVYYKLNMFLNQIRYTPIEFAARVCGFKSIVIDALKSVASDSDSKVHRELEKIIKKLEISPKDDSPFEASIWARIHNDVQLFLNTPQVDPEYIKEMLKSVLKLNWDEETKRKFCGKTPFQVIKVLELLPYLAVLPSDMGFPIMIETHSTQLVSLKGEMDVSCASPGLPSITLHSSLKTGHSWSGYAGTVSPFQEQEKLLLAAGIDTQHTLNIPLHTVVTVEPSAGGVRLEMKQVDQVTPHTDSVDFVNMHVLPFTTKKPVIFSDITPIILDRTNTRILQSDSPKKKFDSQMGQSLGLDIKHQVETESDLLDRKTLLDIINNYRYNPYVASIFGSTFTAIRADGSPSIRYHKSTLVHSPQNSNTKELNVALVVSAVQQDAAGQVLQYIALGSDKRSKQVEKLSQSVQKLRSSNVFSTNVLVKISLIGGSQKTFSYSLTAAKGFTEQEHKWILELESEMDPGMVCISGNIKPPIIWEGQRKVSYNNRIGFGSSCDDYYVTVDGFTATSQSQVEASRISEAGKKCAKLSLEVTELQERIQPQGESKARMEQEYAELRDRKIEYCEEQRKEESSLDQVEFNITTSPQLPSRVYSIARCLDFSLKGFLAEYISGLSSADRYSNPVIKVFLGFNQRLDSVTMRVSSPIDSILYEDIHLPSWSRNFLPISYSKSVLEQSYKALYGSPLHPQCSIFKDHIKTFSQETYRYSMDDCNHLVVSGCSQSKSHAILAKEKDNVKHVIIYYKETKIELSEPMVRYQSPGSYRVKVDGKEEVVRMGQRMEVRDREGSVSCSIHWSDSHTIEVVTPAHRVWYDGKTLTVEDKSLVAGGQLCGLCGDTDWESKVGLGDTGNCRDDKAMAQSYRVQDSQCFTNISLTDQRILDQELRRGFGIWYYNL